MERWTTVFCRLPFHGCCCGWESIPLSLFNIFWGSNRIWRDWITYRELVVVTIRIASYKSFSEIPNESTPIVNNKHFTYVCVWVCDDKHTNTTHILSDTNLMKFYGSVCFSYKIRFTIRASAQNVLLAVVLLPPFLLLRWASQCEKKSIFSSVSCIYRLCCAVMVLVFSFLVCSPVPFIRTHNLKQSIFLLVFCVETKHQHTRTWKWTIDGIWLRLCGKYG